MKTIRENWILAVSAIIGAALVCVVVYGTIKYPGPPSTKEDWDAVEANL